MIMMMMMMMRRRRRGIVVVVVVMTKTPVHHVMSTLCPPGQCLRKRPHTS
jgi:hypothetical protein